MRYFEICHFHRMFFFLAFMALSNDSTSDLYTGDIGNSINSTLPQESSDFETGSRILRALRMRRIGVTYSDSTGTLDVSMDARCSDQHSSTVENSVCSRRTWMWLPSVSCQHLEWPIDVWCRRTVGCFADG